MTTSRQNSLYDDIEKYMKEQEVLTRAIINTNRYLSTCLGSGRYAEYIFFGAQLAQRYTQSLIQLLVMATNHSLGIEAERNNITNPIFISIEDKPNEMFGNTLRKLRQAGIEEHDELYRKLFTLKEKRDSIAHEFITAYEGDIEKLNEALKTNLSDYRPEETLNLIIRKIGEIKSRMSLYESTHVHGLNK